MTSVEPYPRPWPRGRWIVAVFLLCVIQLACIFWLGQRQWPAPVPAGPSPSLTVVNRASLEWLALEDPTLFALPNVRGFSGPAWIEVPPRPAAVFDWTEAPRFMPLPVEQLGNLFAGFMATNQNGVTPARFRELPAPTLPPPAAPLASPTQSVVRVEGGVPGRELLTQLTAPSWQHVDLLSPTVLQLVVDSRGWPVSTTLLSSSGRPDVDQFALQQARTARFEPLLDREPGQTSQIASPLSWVRLIFDWHTLPAQPTNTVTPLP
jgi:hypothetical protein